MAQQLTVLADALGWLAGLLQDEGKLGEAESMWRERLAMCEKAFGKSDPRTDSALIGLGFVLENEGKAAEAETLLRAALASVHNNPEREASFLSPLADVLGRQRKLAEAESLYRQELAINKQLFGDGAPEIDRLLIDLAETLHGQGKAAEAQGVIRDALASRRNSVSDNPDNNDRLRTALAKLLRWHGKFAEAETICREAWANAQPFATNNPSELQQRTIDLVSILQDQGKFSEAETLASEGLARDKRVWGNDNPALALSLSTLAGVLASQRKFAQAELLFREALALHRKFLGDQHPDLGNSLNDLAWVLEAQGNYNEAEPLRREASEVEGKSVGNKNWLRVFSAQTDHAASLIAQGKFDEAVRLLHQPGPNIDETPSYSAPLFNQRGGLLARLGLWDEATGWVSRAREADPADHWTYHLLAHLLAHTGKAEAYREVCCKMRNQFRGTRLPVVAERMAKACCLLPPSAEDFEVIRQWSETAVSAGEHNQPPPWGELAKGLTEFRQGQFEESLDWLRKAVLQGDKYIEAIAQPVIATAQYRLGQTQQARASLAAAVEALRRLPQLGSRDLGNWDDILVANLFLREAQALILGKPAGPSDAE